MVKASDEQLNTAFHVLADPTRRKILQQLVVKHQALSVTELAQPHNMSLPAISKHLKVLETSGMISRIKAGRSYNFKLVKQPVETAALWVLRYLHSFQK